MTATQGMQAVARSLGMTFEVQYAQREPLKTFEIARELVARADVTELAGIGHYPQVEAPRDVLSAYLDFRSHVRDAA